MSYSKALLSAAAVFTLAVTVSACASAPEAEGDPPEVTCERFHTVIDEFRDVDPSSMGLGEMLAHVSDGFTEMETVADHAQDQKLAESIRTMSKTLNSSLASAGGDLEVVTSEFEERLQEPDVQDAATYLADTCGMIPYFGPGGSLPIPD